MTTQLEKLIRYIAEDEKASNRLASKYGYFPASSEEGRIGMLIRGMQEEGDDFLRDMGIVHPDKDIILAAHSNFIGEDMSYLEIPPMGDGFKPRTYKVEEKPMQMYSYNENYRSKRYPANADGLSVQDSSLNVYDNKSIDAPFMMRFFILVAIFFVAYNTLIK